MRARSRAAASPTRCGPCSGRVRRGCAGRARCTSGASASTRTRDASPRRVRRERSYSYSLGWETRHHSANFAGGGPHNPLRARRARRGDARRGGRAARGRRRRARLISLQLGGWTPVATLPPGCRRRRRHAPPPDGSAQSVTCRRRKLCPASRRRRVGCPTSSTSRGRAPSATRRRRRRRRCRHDGAPRVPAPRPGDAVSRGRKCFPAEGVSALARRRDPAVAAARPLAPRLARGAVPAEEMIDEARGESRRTWLRAAGAASRRSASRCCSRSSPRSPPTSRCSAASPLARRRRRRRRRRRHRAQQLIAAHRRRLGAVPTLVRRRSRRHRPRAMAARARRQATGRALEVALRILLLAFIPARRRRPPA